MKEFIKKTFALSNKLIKAQNYSNINSDKL